MSSQRNRAFVRNLPYNLSMSDDLDGSKAGNPAGEAAGEQLADARIGKNGRHALVGPLRQSVFGTLAGYEDVNDAEQPPNDPALRWIVGGTAAKGRSALAGERPPTIVNASALRPSAGNG